MPYDPATCCWTVILLIRHWQAVSHFVRVARGYGRLDVSWVVSSCIDGVEQKYRRRYWTLCSDIRTVWCGAQSFKTLSKWRDYWACRFATIGATWTQTTSAVFRNGWATAVVEQTDARRAVDRSRSQRRRNAETTQQTDCRRTAERSRIQRRRRVQKSAMQTFKAATQKCRHADTHLCV